MKKLPVLALFAAVAVLAMTMGLGGCGDSVAKGPKIVCPLTPPQLGVGELQPHWMAGLPLDTKNHEQVQTLYYRPGHIYAMTTRNRLLAMNAKTGDFLWSARVGEPGLQTTPVVQFGETVLVTVLDELHIFALADGTELAKLALPRVPGSPFVTNGQFVYYGTGEGWLESIHIASGAKSWDRLTFSTISAAPAVSADQVFFANHNGEVYAASANARIINWRFMARDAISGDLKITPSGLVLVPSRDYTLYALNPVMGRPAWICTVGDPLLTAPYAIGDRVYFIKQGNIMYAVSEVNGNTPLWNAEKLTQFLAASPLTVFARTTAGDVAALSPADGTVKFTYPAGTLAAFAVNEIDGQVFASTRDGEVVALREPKIDYSLPPTPPAAPAPAVAPTPVVPEPAPAAAPAVVAEEKAPAPEAPKTEAAPKADATTDAK